MATRTVPPVKLLPCAVSLMVDVAYQAVGPITPLLFDPAAIPKLAPNWPAVVPEPPLALVL